jgi:hypothetical protein
MNDQHRDLDELLRAHGAAPAHLPGFAARLAAGLADADAEMGRATGTAGAAGRRRLRLPRPRLPWTRHLIVATAFTAGVAAVIAAVVLVGIPGVSRVTGPQPVSAAEVIQRALRALSSGSTIQADITEKYATSMLPDGVPEYAVIGARIVMRSDGSFRITRTRARQVSWDTPGSSPYAPGPLLIDPDALDRAYDAERGVVRDYYRSSESPRYRFEVTTGHPLGPPDRWADFQADLSAVALALQTGGSATVETTAIDGRPAWVLSMKGSLALRQPGETYSIAIDQETCLPVRVEIAKDGVVMLEYRWKNVRVDEPVPDATFRMAAPEGVRVYRYDNGFRRASLAQVGQAAGSAPWRPSWLPSGYRLRWSAVAERATLVTGVVGRDVVALQYGRGFDALTVTTRRVADPTEAVAFDPFEPEPYWSDVVGRDVHLEAGAFAGAIARVVVAPRTTVPHLYAVEDGILLTVAGRATADELVSIAESLEP